MCFLHGGIRTNGEFKIIENMTESYDPRVFQLNPRGAIPNATLIADTFQSV